MDHSSNRTVLTRDQIDALIAKKRNYRQEIKDLTNKYRYVVVYGCGIILNSIVDVWNEYIGRRIDYSCDSSSAKWGKVFCGATCLSPDELTAIKDECAVFVTMGDFKPVYDLLIERGFPSVNLIYKYDLISSAFLANHLHDEIASNLCAAYELLSDAKSREVFAAIVNRILGGSRDPCIMANVCEAHQYFPPDIIKLSCHESFVDIGAFNGDTVLDFAERTQRKFDAVHSFEVDAFNFELLKENIRKMPEHDRIKIINLGIWDSEGTISYSIGNSNSTVGKGTGKGRVVPLDDVLGNEKVTFIKMDIEGAELHALRGSRIIIKTQKPKMAVCTYHDFTHLWMIPQYLKGLVPEYKIYLRHHNPYEYETVCYAVL
jgi:FkbM family methyltransferase